MSLTTHPCNFLNALASSATYEILKTDWQVCELAKSLGPFLQHIIFFLTYEWAGPNKLECLSLRGIYSLV